MRNLYKNFISVFAKCERCLGSGEYLGTGMIKTPCDDCKWHMGLKKFWDRFLNSLKSKYIAEWVFCLFCVSLVFYIILIITNSYYQFILETLVITFFASLFPALIYKLNFANYHKTLFEKRFAVFQVIDDVLYASNHEWMCADGTSIDPVKKLDSVYRRSYFLFGKKTYKFLIEFRKAIVNLKTNTASIQQTEFLNILLDSNKLAENFPELKIDVY